MEYRVRSPFCWTKPVPWTARGRSGGERYSVCRLAARRPGKIKAHQFRWGFTAAFPFRILFPLFRFYRFLPFDIAKSSFLVACSKRARNEKHITLYATRCSLLPRVDHVFPRLYLCVAIPRVVCSVRDFRDFRVTPAPDSPFNATRFLFHSFLPCPKSKRIREVQE